MRYSRIPYYVNQHFIFSLNWNIKCLVELDTSIFDTPALRIMILVFSLEINHGNVQKVRRMPYVLAVSQAGEKTCQVL